MKIKMVYLLVITASCIHLSKNEEKTRDIRRNVELGGMLAWWLWFGEVIHVRKMQARARGQGYEHTAIRSSTTAAQLNI